MEESQIATDSLRLIKRMLSGEMTREEKYLGMMELDKKYPAAGFYRVAQEYANRALRFKKPEVRDKKLASTGEKDEEYPF